MDTFLKTLKTELDFIDDFLFYQVPTVVRKSMEHFLQLDHTEDDFDDDEGNEFEMLKQDIDHL